MQFSSLPINSSLQNNPRYQFSLKSENIEILPILSVAILKIAAIRSRFVLVRILYQPYLIYMPSLVEINDENCIQDHFYDATVSKMATNKIGKLIMVSDFNEN
jgi:hypothetical protein